MTTGLKCRDSQRYGFAGYMAMQQSADWAKYVLDLPMEAAPGEKFEYCNGASFLLAAILEKATGTDVLEFAKTHLFMPLGIKDVFWSGSSRNIRNGCCGLSLTRLDMLKIGWLFLNRGRWKDRQLISPDWIDRSTQGHVKASDFGYNHDYYGYQWWRDAQGYYMAIGYRGQRIFVIPRKRMVVVFTGRQGNHISRVPKQLVDDFIIPAAKDEGPLPPEAKQQARLTALVTAAAGAQNPDRTSSQHLR
jgi:CubicO group peptidase (beta-lactamase class C family)